MRVVEATGDGLAAVGPADRPEPPEPGPGEVKLQMLAMSVNPADLLLLEGRYGVKPEPPFIPGAEGVARVMALGEGVDDIAVGDLAIPLPGPAWVERMTLPRAAVVPIPEGADLDQAAMLKANPATALAMLRDLVDLQPGDWVAQNAANSAVGVNVIRLAKSLGLKTINVVRRPGPEDRLYELGADAVLVHDGEGLPPAAPGEAKVAFDAVGGWGTEALAKLCAPGAVIANYGLLSGEPCRIDPSHLVFRDITLKGFWLSKWFQEQPKEKIAATYAFLVERLKTGEIGAPVAARYPLEQAADAVAHAVRDARDGKVLLTTEAHPDA